MNLPILGIDISKETADFCFRREGKSVHRTFENRPAGFRRLARWLENFKCQQIYCCMEATGRYWEALALFLHQSGHIVSVVNPSTVSAYRKAELCRSKTDKGDAALLARYCAAVRPRSWKPPGEEQIRLQQLVRHLDSLKNMRSQEKNRLSAGLTDGEIVQVIKDHIQFLSAQINKVKKAIRAHLRSFEYLKRAWALLSSIKGVGESLSFVFLAEVGSIDRFDDVRKLTAFAGLDVRQFSSGTSVQKRPRISKAGNSHLRKALYLPALSAMRSNPVIIEFVARLRERSVHGMAIVCAVMRKLLHTMYGVLKTQTVFNPEVQLRLSPTGKEGDPRSLE
jgi:transposase